jgi:NTE family protein
MNWAALGLGKDTPSASKQAFEQYLVQPLRTVASTTIDAGAIFGGIFLPGTIADHVANRYDELVFHGKTLQDLPSDSAGPRFVINATNVQSGVLMRFSKPYMRDYRVGKAVNPQLPLARAVAASSAFPPILSPCEIDLTKFGLTLTPGNEPGQKPEDLAMPPYTTKLVLSDGGVYDNLGLETAWKKCKNLLVSDGGGHYKPEPDPHHDWARHAFRVLDLIDSQVRALRTRDLIYLFEQKVRDGAYWSIRQDLGKTYGTSAALPCDFRRTTELALVDTRLAKMDASIQERLVNWGYAVCDASIRAFVKKDLPRPSGFPYANTGV